jgi:hypothetical protein
LAANNHVIYELKLSELNHKIAELLSEREAVIKEWNQGRPDEQIKILYGKTLRNRKLPFTET